MFFDNLNEQFSHYEYNKLPLTQQGIYGFLKREEGLNTCIIFLNLPEELSGNVWNIRYTEQQVKAEIHEEGITRFLFVYITDQPEQIKCLCEDNFDGHWILDREEARVLIYENQQDNYDNVKNIIESSLVNKEPKRKFTSYCTAGLIGINVLIYIIMYVICSYNQRNFLIDYGGLFWPAVTKNYEVYRLITSIFIHSGISHLFNNMVLLYFVGSYLEEYVGHTKFAFLYFVSGILAGVVSMSYNIINNKLILSIGASGAIFGIVGALACFIFLSKGAIRDITGPRLLFFIGLSVFSGIHEQGVDNMAHFGGLISGFLLALSLILFQRMKIKGPKTER